ncbi:hypothetical protein ACQJBY_069713 [Aegilops geniculata]
MMTMRSILFLSKAELSTGKISPRPATSSPPRGSQRMRQHNWRHRPAGAHTRYNPCSFVYVKLSMPALMGAVAVDGRSASRGSGCCSVGITIVCGHCTRVARVLRVVDAMRARCRLRRLSGKLELQVYEHGGATVISVPYISSVVIN